MGKADIFYKTRSFADRGGERHGGWWSAHRRGGAHCQPPTPKSASHLMRGRGLSALAIVDRFASAKGLGNQWHPSGSSSCRLQTGVGEDLFVTAPTRPNCECLPSNHQHRSTRAVAVLGGRKHTYTGTTFGTGGVLSSHGPYTGQPPSYLTFRNLPCERLVYLLFSLLTAASCRGNVDSGYGMTCIPRLSTCQTGSPISHCLLIRTRQDHGGCHSPFQKHHAEFLCDGKAIP